MSFSNPAVIIGWAFFFGSLPTVPCLSVQPRTCWVTRVLSRNREKRWREAWGSGKRYLSLSLQASLGRFSRLRNETQTRGASTERTSCSLALVMSLAEFLKLLSIISTMLNREPMKGRRRLPRERHKTIDLMSRNNDSARPARAFQISIHFFVVFVTQFIGRVRQRHVTQS